MTISSISFVHAPGAQRAEATFYEFYLDMGYCSNNELGAYYAENYVSGSKIRVFERTGNITFYASDPTIYFDSPFFFNPVNGNLIIDISWPDGEDEFYVYNHGTAGVSCVTSGFYDPSGYVFTDMAHLFLQGTWSMEQTTFAGIKASFM